MGALGRMKFVGEAILCSSSCGKVIGEQSFPLGEFEAKGNKTLTAKQKAFEMALRSLWRRMEKAEDERLIGVDPEEVKIIIYESVEEQRGLF